MSAKKGDNYKENRTKRLISVKELSQMIDLTEDTIYRWVSQRKIPYVKVGRLTKFDIKAIDKWIEENSVSCKDFS